MIECHLCKRKVTSGKGIRMKLICQKCAGMRSVQDIRTEIEERKKVCEILGLEHPEQKLESRIYDELLTYIDNK